MPRSQKTIIPRGREGRLISYALTPLRVNDGGTEWRERRRGVVAAFDWICVKAEMAEGPLITCRSGARAQHVITDELATIALRPGANTTRPGSERIRNWAHDILLAGLPLFNGLHLGPGQALSFQDLRELALAAHVWPRGWVICARCGLVCWKPRGGRYCRSPLCVHGRTPVARHQSGAYGHVTSENGRWHTTYYVACCDPSCQPAPDPFEEVLGPPPFSNGLQRSSAFGHGEGAIFPTRDARQLYCDLHRTAAAEQRRVRSSPVGGITKTLKRHY